MRSHLFPLALVLVVACGGGERDGEGLPSEPVPPVEVAPAPHLARPQLYDDDHVLLASDVRVAGLTMPMGLTETPSGDDRTHVFMAQDLPVQAFLRYFGPRLTTGQVEPQPGGGAIYRNAIPREVEGGAVPLDVRIAPLTQGQILVEVHEIPPAPTTPPSEAQSFRALGAAMQSAE